MNSRKPLNGNLILAVMCFSFLFLLGEPHNVEAANENNPPRAIRLDDIFITPSTGTSSSIIGGNIVQITPAVNNQKGGIWSTETNKMDLTKDFRATMYLYLGGDESPTLGGDGMAFVMHNDPRGTNALSPFFGESLGVWASSTHGAPKDEGIKNSLAIEFDKFFNNSATNTFFDAYVTEGHHVAWNYPGKDSTYEDFRDAARNKRAMVHNDTQYVENFSDDTWRKFEVNWNATKKELTYHLEGLSKVTIPINVQDVFGANEVYWGFTGSTGGSSAYQRVTFDGVPGLVEAAVHKEITRENGTVVTEDTSVFIGEELTYSIQAQYLSGKQDWFNIAMSSVINENVTYVPGSLTLTEGMNESQTLDDKFWSGQSLTVPAEILGNMSSTRSDVNISFKVKVNSVSKDTTVTEATHFLGYNFNLDAEVTYTISNYQIPKVTIDEEGPIYIPVGEDYIVRGTWESVDSDIVDLYYVVNDGTPVKFGDGVKNAANKGDAVSFEFTIPASELSIGTHMVTVYAVDDREAKSNKEIITLVVKGILTFTTVSENVYFENTYISQTTIISKRSEGWNIAVKDTRGDNSPWKVTATLSEEFSDGNERFLKDALIYVDAHGKEISMELNEPVYVFEHTTINENEVPVSWDEDKGILLKICPHFYAGEYTGAITWTLVDGL